MPPTRSDRHIYIDRNPVRTPAIYPVPQSAILAAKFPYLTTPQCRTNLRIWVGTAQEGSGKGKVSAGVSAMHRKIPPAPANGAVHSAGSVE